MQTVFAYLFAGIGLYLFDTPFRHPFRTPQEQAAYLAKPCNEPHNRDFYKTKKMPVVGDTVWINHKDKPREGFWVVLTEIEQ